VGGAKREKVNEGEYCRGGILYLCMKMEQQTLLTLKGSVERMMKGINLVKIYYMHICKYHNVSPLYNYYMLIIKKYNSGLR
jgi:hypothetical protein